MNSSRVIMTPCRITVALLLAFPLVPDVAFAQTAPPVATTLAPDDQSALDNARALQRNEALWNKPIDWNEKNASLGTIANHVQSALGPDAPTIEMRAPDVNRSTFALSKAPVGTTLISLAKLANCKVWVFADGIVIAPETALTDEERAAVKAKKGGDWTQSSTVFQSSESWNGRAEVESTSVRILSIDLKARLAVKGQTTPVAVDSSDPTKRKTAPFQLPFGELSPAAQKVLQELFAETMKRFAGYATQPGFVAFPPPPGAPPRPTETTILPPSVVVCFDDTQPNMSQTTLFLQSDELDLGQARWYVLKPKRLNE